MHHPSLNDILLAVASAVVGIGVVPAMRYGYRTCKSNTPLEQRLRRAVIWYEVLFCAWQSCHALHLPAMRSPWMDYAVSSLMLALLPITLLVLVVQARIKRLLQINGFFVETNL